MEAYYWNWQKIKWNKTLVWKGLGKQKCLSFSLCRGALCARGVAEIGITVIENADLCAHYSALSPMVGSSVTDKKLFHISLFGPTFTCKTCWQTGKYCKFFLMKNKTALQKSLKPDDNADKIIRIFAAGHIQEKRVRWTQCINMKVKLWHWRLKHNWRHCGKFKFILSWIFCLWRKEYKNTRQW